jgi:hypothetical protein
MTTKKAWCRHIKLKNTTVYGWGKRIPRYCLKSGWREVVMGNSWRFCPICGKERP